MQNISDLTAKVDSINKYFEEQVVGQVKSYQDRIKKVENYIKEKEMKSNIGEFIKKDNKDNLEFKALGVEAEAEGGNLVSGAISAKIIEGLNYLSPMRRLANIEHISTSYLDIFIEDDEFTAGWVGEAQARDETDNANIIRKRILINELYAQPKTTQKLLDDSLMDINKWLVGRLSESFLKNENEAFITGDGEGKPRGILSYDEDEITQIAATNEGTISIEDLYNLIDSLHDNFLKNAYFLMNRRTLSVIRQLKDDAGRFIWQPALIRNNPDTILGIPVEISSDMPVIGSDSLAIALADFKAAYTIVDRKDIALMTDPYTEKPYVKFYATKRTGGDVVNTKAIKLLKL